MAENQGSRECDPDLMDERATPLNLACGVDEDMRLNPDRARVVADPVLNNW